ncbi:MAG: sulfatase/phosphatase domain-containing protein, partial [Bacteroidales bacterium]
SYGPLRGTKRDLYEGGIRVPLIAWAPEMVPAGTVSDLPCAFWDMMPTFADMINAPKEKNTDGISFLPTLKGKKQSKKHDYLYWEFHELGGRQALRQGDWKLIAQNVGDSQKTTFELYNLKNDIHEDNDLSTQYPKIVEKMKKEMERARTESNTFDFGREKN